MTKEPQNFLDDVRVVLLRPRWARNLGSVARAMKNFGLNDLTLVDSKIGSWNDAYQMAVHAGDILDNATSMDLTEALAPANWVVGTSNNPPPGTRQLTPSQVAEETLERGAPTLLFGGEIHGLDPAEMLRCHVVSCIPTAPEQSSLNLGQAVCVYGAELFAAQAMGADRVAPGTEDPEALLASTDLLQHLEAALQRMLESSAWGKADRPKNSIAALMQPFYRAHLTKKEARAWLVALGKATPR
ncbi:MAG: rRNA methyltransferase [Myxococcota bacterium]|nr:rRNA methyltransferase [Myxococcota bacterium]